MRKWQGIWLWTEPLVLVIQRLATHGVPNDVNSHPHFSNSGDLVIIHNGIIENYAPLKEKS
jgi:glucosamine 6-phosphate synthetase-like amidotransferase/phosphosugar isomerase protein